MLFFKLSPINQETVKVVYVVSYHVCSQKGMLLSKLNLPPQKYHISLHFTLLVIFSHRVFKSEFDFGQSHVILPWQGYSLFPPEEESYSEEPFQSSVYPSSSWISPPDFISLAKWTDWSIFCGKFEEFLKARKPGDLSM